MKKFINLVLRLIVAIILLQTLYYKFTAHPDSVYIFSALGVEPWGRIGLGVVELITSILILFGRTKLVGMILSLGIILGAIGSHFLVIGINVSGDGGTLFMLAIIVFVCSSIYLLLNKNDIVSLIKKLIK